VCEAEQWEDALIELKRQSYVPSVRHQEAAWRAKIYVGMERYQEVLKLVEEARRNSCDIGPYLAIAHARLGHSKEALRIAHEAYRVKRKGAEMALGHVYFASKEYDQALRWFETAAQNRLQRASAQREIGRTLVTLGDYWEACVAYEQAIRLTPFVLPEDLRQLADCLRKTDRERAADEQDQLAVEKA
jgi:tetratricopeptide (TPR) repeat protein